MKNPKSREEWEVRMSESLVGKAVGERLEETVYRKKSLKRQVVGIVLILAVAVLFTRVLFGLALVEGSSMYPEYHDGDLVVYSRIAGNPERDDVILVKVDDSRILIKRVIGLPGEEVYIDGGTGSVFINGNKLEEEYGATDPEEYLSYPVTLGEDEYFVLGDNRGNSLDSRYYGPVMDDRIRGEVLMTFRMGAQEVKDEKRFST